MTTFGFLLMSSVGVWLVSGLSPIPPRISDQCAIPPCAPPPRDLPEGQPWPPRCQDQCRTDRDCGRRGLCCPGCGCKSCQQRAPIDSCLTRVCPAGTVCVDTQVYCKRPPCPRTSCEKVSTKPGVCPAFYCPGPVYPTCQDQCRTDNDCKGSGKCCIDCNACGVCTTEPGIDTCSNTQCPGGEKCVADPTPRCVCLSGVIVTCYAPPCEFARCDNHPNAVCSDNYCGGCYAVWRENGQIVTDCLSFKGSSDGDD